MLKISTYNALHIETNFYIIKNITKKFSNYFNVIYQLLLYYKQILRKNTIFSFFLLQIIFTYKNCLLLSTLFIFVNFNTEKNRKKSLLVTIIFRLYNMVLIRYLDLRQINSRVISNYQHNMKVRESLTTGPMRVLIKSFQSIICSTFFLNLLTLEPTVT